MSNIKKLANFSRVSDIATDVNDFFTFSSASGGSSNSNRHDRGDGNSSQFSSRYSHDTYDCRVLLRILSFQFLPIEIASDSATITNPFCSNWRVRVELLSHQQQEEGNQQQPTNHSSNQDDVFDSYVFDINGSLVQSHSSIDSVFSERNGVRPCKVVLSQLNSNSTSNSSIVLASTNNSLESSQQSTTTTTTNLLQNNSSPTNSNMVICSNLFDMIFEEKSTILSSSMNMKSVSPRSELLCALCYTFPFPHFLIEQLYFKISIYTVEKPNRKQQQEFGNQLIETLVAYCKTDVISTMYQPLNTAFINKKIRIRALKKRTNDSKNALNQQQKPRCNIQVKVEKFI
ncbi:hypothetical protein C9374_008121 [Naegleria lovaniensis]|uniref:Uncharacterized protein n=1 Tax=Naegleria lovaniensis TaxID=51637 RepID=A0AA88GJG4_NAELO|nr:uncharacterized protein C9374_008121 [Naegleria lovaniensis]KAG2378482.1 hypothetical protein C9374_008121 [Naegleria lovaniensis]